MITASNLPDLGMEPFKRYDNGNRLISVQYTFLNGSSLGIGFDFTGNPIFIVYNGMALPLCTTVKLIDGELHIIIP